MSTATAKESYLSSTDAHTTKTAPQSYRASRKYAWSLITTSVIAFIAAFILVLERLELYKDPAHVASCDVGGPLSCSSVMLTPQAALFGFPNPLIGIVCFAITGTIGVVLLLGVRLPRWFFVATFGGTTIAMFLVGWFWFQALYVINMLCAYCIIVWIMAIPMFWKTALFTFTEGIIPSNPHVKKFLTKWTRPIIVLFYLAVIFSTLFAFTDTWITMIRG